MSLDPVMMQLLIVYAFLAGVGIALAPFSPFRRSLSPDAGPLSPFLLKGIFLLLPSVALLSFFIPWAPLIAGVGLAHFALSVGIALSKKPAWKNLAWSALWVFQSLVFWVWLILNPSRPVADGFIQ